MRPNAITSAVAFLLAGSGSAGAEAALDVSGAVIATKPRLEVRVEVANRGDRRAAPLTLTGELLGQEREARLPAGVAPGGKGSVVLDFESGGARPGVHPLALLLEYPIDGAPDAAGNPPMASRRAWLLLALGETTSPPVRLWAKPVRLDVSGAIEVAVESADEAPHRVRLRALTARGLRSSTGLELEAPAQGAVSARLPLMRAGAPRGSRHAVLLVAEAQDGPLARTTVATATVEVVADPSLLPRWRGKVLAVGIVLLSLAVAAEIWRWRSGRSLPPPTPLRTA